MTLLNAFEKLKNGDVSYKTIKTLYEYCTKIALHNLKYNYSRYSQVVQKSGWDIEEIANSAVAKLFTKMRTKEIIYLQSSILLWRDDLSTEDDIIFFLQQIVSKKTEQQIVEFQRESDPAFYKILKNVKEHVSLSKDFKIIVSYGKKCIVKKEVKEIGMRIPDYEDLEMLPYEYFRQPMKKLVSNALLFFENQNHFFSALPLNYFVEIIKLRGCEDYVVEYNDLKNPENTFIVEEISDRALAGVFRIIDGYKKAKKINNREYIVFIKVVSDIIEELKAGFTFWGFYEYFYEYIPELSKSEYMKKYNGKIIYIYKTLCKDIMKK